MPSIQPSHAKPAIPSAERAQIVADLIAGLRLPPGNIAAIAGLEGLDSSEKVALIASLDQDLHCTDANALATRVQRYREAELPQDLRWQLLAKLMQRNMRWATPALFRQARTQIVADFEKAIAVRVDRQAPELSSTQTEALASAKAAWRDLPYSSTEMMDGKRSGAGASGKEHGLQLTAAQFKALQREREREDAWSTELVGESSVIAALYVSFLREHDDASLTEMALPPGSERGRIATDLANFLGRELAALKASPKLWQYTQGSLVEMLEKRLAALEAALDPTLAPQPTITMSSSTSTWSSMSWTTRDGLAAD